MQLSHFGEVFDSQKCKMSIASCDNCRASGKQEKKDVTVLVKSILKGIQRLQILNGFNGKFTLNHIVEVIRGGKSKKVLQCNWDKDPMYGTAKHYSLEMCSKILRKMVSEKLIREEIETNAYGAVTYLKLGINSHKFLNDFSKEIFFIITQSKIRQME